MVVAERVARASRSTTSSSGTCSSSSQSLAAGQPGADRAGAHRRARDVAHDRAAGAVRARRRGPVGAPAGFGHLRRRAEDHLAAADDELHRAGRGLSGTRPAPGCSRRPVAGRRRRSPRGWPCGRAPRCTSSSGCAWSTTPRWRSRRSHLSAARFPGLIAELRKTSSLYRVLSENYGVQPVEAEETIETAAGLPARRRAARRRHRRADPGARPAQLRRRRHADRVRAQLVPRRPLHLRRPAALKRVRDS